MKLLIEQLPERQGECFDYMLLGYGYKEIGVMMGITLGAVGNTASKVLKKCDVSDRVTMILKYYDLPNWSDDFH